MTDLDSASGTRPRGRRAAQEADGEELTIQQASELLEVPAPTLRSWERRCGVPPPAAAAAGTVATPASSSTSSVGCAI